MSINRYEENRILSASPAELVRILYEAAIRAVGAARGHLRNGDIAGRSREISKTQMILLELSNSVDCALGGEFAKRVIELYDYMLNLLVEAHVTQQDAPLEEINKLLRTLQEGWVGVELPYSAEPVAG